MDLNLDGRTDVISGSWPGEIYYFERQADGAFAAPTTLSHADGQPINAGLASSVFVVDWNGDGALDMLVGNLGGEVLLLPGAASGGLTFGEAEKLQVEIDGARKPIGVPGGDTAPVAADWDGDGDLDLIVGTGHGAVLLYRREIAGESFSLAPPVELIPESSLGWGGDNQRAAGEWGLRVKPCVVDWNGDGKLDLLLGDRCGGFVGKASQTAEEEREEREANDRLPELRKAWADAFAQYEQAKRAADAQGAKRLLDRVTRLRDDIARVREIQVRFQPGEQTHGFVWVFLRKASK